MNEQYPGKSNVLCDLIIEKEQSKSHNVSEIGNPVPCPLQVT
jgi:hypothetical protein